MIWKPTIISDGQQQNVTMPTTISAFFLLWNCPFGQRGEPLTSADSLVLCAACPQGLGGLKSNENMGRGGRYEKVDATAVPAAGNDARGTNQFSGASRNRNGGAA